MRWHRAFRPLLPATLALALGAAPATAQRFSVHGELSYGVAWSLEPPATPEREYRLGMTGAGPLSDWLWASAQLDTDAPDLIPFAVAVATWDGTEMVAGDFDIQLQGVEMVSLRRQLRGGRLVLEPGRTPFARTVGVPGPGSAQDVAGAGFDGEEPGPASILDPPASPFPLRPSLMVWSSTVRSLAWEERFEVLDPDAAADDDDPHTVGPTTTLKLELAPVLEGSETVRKNGRLLEAPLDYQIDAAAGVLYFDPPLEEGDVVEISYRVAPLSPEPLEGARLGLDLPGLSFSLLGLDGLGYDAPEAGGELLPPLYGFTVRMDPGPILVRLERWVTEEPVRLTSGLPPYLPGWDDVPYVEDGDPDACATWSGSPQAWAWELGLGAGGFQASRSYRLRTPGFPTLDDPEAQADWAEEASSLSWQLSPELALSWRASVAWPCWSDPLYRMVERQNRRQVSYRTGPGSQVTLYTLERETEDELFGGGTFREAMGVELAGPLGDLSARGRLERAVVVETDLSQETQVRLVEASLSRPLGLVTGSLRLLWQEERTEQATAAPFRLQTTWEVDARSAWRASQALTLNGRWTEAQDKAAQRTTRALGVRWQAPGSPWSFSTGVAHQETGGTLQQVEDRLDAGVVYERGRFRVEITGELPLGERDASPTLRLAAVTGRNSLHRVEGRASRRGGGGGQLSLHYAYQPDGPSTPRFRATASVVPQFFQVEKEQAHLDVEYFVNSAWGVAAAWDATGGDGSTESQVHLQLRYRF